MNSAGGPGMPVPLLSRKSRTVPPDVSEKKMSTTVDRNSWLPRMTHERDSCL